MPIHWQAAFKQQLSEMQATGIIKPVDHDTPWLNSFVVVNKKQLDKHGKLELHICLDPSSLNQMVAMEFFLL